MKKNVLLALGVVSLVMTSCEVADNSENASVTIEKNQEDVLEIDGVNYTSIADYKGDLLSVYNGIGTVNSKGIVDYFVGLDPDEKNEYKFQIFKIKNEGFLIHLSTKNDIALKNINHNFGKINFDLKKQEPSPKEYKVVLYHDNGVIDKKQAVEIYSRTNAGTNSKTAKVLSPPDTTGTGTIRPK